ncbi:mannose-P-dolichol utilization defect 1 protein-like isoform X1 [Takifugu rubripes]|nr:mannose-P-dolichol utilization defect 1 protein-like isoform X1 [Takifugu rubripes]XP_056909915.1 mannose-P-dolichol utilization defect 1 protein-like [Takifugu flavidus]
MTIKEFLVSFLMPEKCYETFFVEFHPHVACFVFVLNKIFGFWILLDALLEQLPQLLKILWRRSAAGLSLTSALLQLYACSCPVLYAAANSFPLYSWGERLLTLVQSVAIVFLIVHYRGKTMKGLWLLSAYTAAMFLLGSYAAAAVVSLLHESRLAAAIASKGFQARMNHINGHTGQLSSASVLLSCAGSLGLTFVTLQERESFFLTAAHILSTCVSCVLLAQICCYRSRKTILKNRNR